MYAAEDVARIDAGYVCCAAGVAAGHVAAPARCAVRRAVVVARRTVSGAPG